jgi:hypothetical protein
VGGVSYFALLARQARDRNTPGGIWVLGLGTDPANRFVRRVDDGAPAAGSGVRLEPEPWLGRREVYVYCNYYDPATGRHGLRRAATGIPVQARLANLSVRSRLAAGQALTVGAVATGGAQEVLVRAAGPALNQFGLAGLADPRVELFTGGTSPVAVNEDWPAALGPVAAGAGG